MPSGGDYLFYQRTHSNKSIDGALAAGATITVSAKSVNHRLYVQKVQVAIVTHANAKKVTLVDTAGSPVTIGVVNDLTAAAGVPDVVVFDFGPKGRAVTLGKNFTVVSDASGPVADIHIEAYEKLDNTIAYDSGAALQ